MAIFNITNKKLETIFIHISNMDIRISNVEFDISMNQADSNFYSQNTQ